MGQGLGAGFKKLSTPLFPEVGDCEELKMRMQDRGWGRPSGARQGQPVAKRDSAPPMKLNPMGEERFQELMRGASALFAAAERDEVAEKAQTIKEIKALMGHYNLSLADLGI